MRYYNNLHDRALADYQVKREVGLVIPGCYNARTNREKIVGILSTEIKIIKGCYPHFELEIEQDATRTPVLIKQQRE